MALHLGTNWNCNSNKAWLQHWNLIGFATVGSFRRQNPKLKTCSYETGKHIKWSCNTLWCKFSAVFESELTETSVTSGNKIEEMSGCPGGDQSDSEQRKKGSWGISSCNAWQGTGQQWLMSDLIYCWEFLHHFFWFYCSCSNGRKTCRPTLCVRELQWELQGQKKGDKSKSAFTAWCRTLQCK